MDARIHQEAVALTWKPNWIVFNKSRINTSDFQSENSKLLLIENKLRFELGSTQAEAVRLQFYKKFKFS